MQLSDLSVKSQPVQLAREDLPLGPCQCAPRLEDCEQELGAVRSELGERVRELEELRGEVTAVREEHAAAEEEIGDGLRRLQAVQLEKAHLDQQVSSQHMAVSLMYVRLSLYPVASPCSLVFYVMTFTSEAVT